MLVLGVESSCDETGVALYDSERGLVAHELYSQVKLHAKYGGVVPELASRDHVRKTIPLIQTLLEKSHTQKSQIDAVAFTAGPGLAGALMVGAGIGRALAWALKKPAIAIHHMEGHLLAPLLETPAPEFPFLCLLVSGGHTLLVDVQALGNYQVLGESLDDAVGEAFDKTAKILGLGYPGGPALAKLAYQGNANRFKFPRPMTNRPGLDFSFSGLKTFALNTLNSCQGSEQDKADIALAFEQAAVDTLRIKCQRGLQQTGHKQLVVAGGVSANQVLRDSLQSMVVKNQAKVFFPRLEFSTDNGAMIAFAGYLRLARGESSDLSFKAKPRWSLQDLT